MAQVAVFGLGRFGFHVARELFERGHEVLAVDREERIVQKIKNLCSRAVQLDIRDRERIEALGVQSFDVAVVSLGGAVDLSTLLSLQLKDLGGPKVITKAGSEDHARLLEKVGVDQIVFPEKEAAVRLARRLSSRNLLEFIPLGESFAIEEIAAPAQFVGKTLAEIDLRNRYGVQVVGIRDALADRIQLNPSPNLKIVESQALIVLGSNDDLQRLVRL